MQLSIFLDKMPLITRIARLILIGMAVASLSRLRRPAQPLLCAAYVALALLLIFLTVNRKGCARCARWYDVVSGWRRG